MDIELQNVYYYNDAWHFDVIARQKLVNCEVIIKMWIIGDYIVMKEVRVLDFDNQPIQYTKFEELKNFVEQKIKELKEIFKVKD